MRPRLVIRRRRAQPYRPLVQEGAMSLITAAALASGLLVPTEASLPPQPHMILALNPSRSRRGARRSNAFTPAGRTRGAIEIPRPPRSGRTRSRPRRNTSDALSVLPVDESRHHAARLLGLISLLETFDAGANRLIQSHVLPIADQLFLQPPGLRPAASSASRRASTAASSAAGATTCSTKPHAS